MISPNLTTKEKALAGVIFLRKCAEVLASTKNPMLRISAEPYCIAADAIEKIVEENEKLREQLVAFQRTANAAVAVDPASGPDTTACYTPFVRGDRVRLKLTPEKHGTVDITRGDDSDTLSCFVHFVYPPEKHSWVSAKLLELIPDE
ncbi:hypothetical protein SQV56_000393 [Salmonella enterica]|nr:hypothetical protein [Salmonella enterica subsp. enterica serovar Typhimurium]EEJ4283164.1 hypothetical protein [Salmonella enterica subsp. diarizonae]EJB6559579.1 hypothetical protein [Salmonella enterica]ELZ0448142.1 hypothetical protein [Salmonella enterica]